MSTRQLALYLTSLTKEIVFFVLFEYLLESVLLISDLSCEPMWRFRLGLGDMLKFTNWPPSLQQPVIADIIVASTLSPPPAAVAGRSAVLAGEHWKTHFIQT